LLNISILFGKSWRVCVRVLAGWACGPAPKSSPFGSFRARDLFKTRPIGYATLVLGVYTLFTDTAGSVLIVALNPRNGYDMTQSLKGRTVALAEGRQLEELAQMLEKEGATALRCPMVSILDAPDAEPVYVWLRDLSAGQFGYVVLMTGEALRRLLGFAERAGLRAAVIAALRQARTVTRGPKPVRALKEVGLNPTKVAEAPTTEGVIATLRHESLHGQTVGVTLYGGPNPALEEFLQAAGAIVRTVMPYVFAPASDTGRVVDLIARMARGEVDVILFTSSPQVDRLYEVAAQRGQQAVLQHGLERTRVAAVGPIVAANLQQREARVDICPEQGFVMKNLVQQIKRVFE
jgi:uroporphyrinogen-III synthase